MIKFVTFIRLSVLIIALFGNETIFGMMLSTKHKHKRSKNIVRIKNMENSIPGSLSISPSLLGKVEQQDESNSKISLLLLGDDIIEHHILPGSDSSVRLVCKKFAKYHLVHSLYSYYCDFGRQVVPACAFLDCVNKGEYEKAKWFLDNKQDEPLFYVTELYNKYSILNPYIIAQNNNDVPMMELLKDYKDYNIFTKIKKVQESIGHIGAKIRSLSRPVDGIPWNEFVMDIYYPLCIAACTGDKNAFELEIKKCSYNDTVDNVLQNNRPLIMWIAIKNRDLSFISYLLNKSSVKQYFNYYMQNEENNLNLLWFMSLNVPLENFYGNDVSSIINSDKVILTIKHIDGVKKIISMGLFPFSLKFSLLQEFKDKNENIKQIYEQVRYAQIVPYAKSLMQYCGSLDQKSAIIYSLYKAELIEYSDKRYQKTLDAIIFKLKILYILNPNIKTPF